ncbi:SGNH/GDSL hydrolase family protein [Demequina sp. SO4-18]|uniref:SGNH/GDSL hydrolase family protein n=1 Tax=Demequina sp. SO4-18 TaxID=3401026 RepID=UPI003B58C95D
MAKKKQYRGYEKPWLKRELGGVPHWATIAVLALLVGLAFYVMWDRSEVDEVPQWAPPTQAAVSTESAAAELGPDGTVVVGDSYTAGSPADSGEDSRWPAIAGVEPIATSGVGYVQGGSGASFVALAEEIPADAATVVFFGSINDASYGYDEVREAADEAFVIAQSNAPDATLIVIGPPWTDADPPAEILTVRDAVSDAASEAEATWVDPIAEDWFVGDNDLIGLDGVHPTDAGHAFLAERISEVLAGQ